jgi:hypothetical protein
LESGDKFQKQQSKDTFVFTCKIYSINSWVKIASHGKKSPQLLGVRLEFALGWGALACGLGVSLCVCLFTCLLVCFFASVFVCLARFFVASQACRT